MMSRLFDSLDVWYDEQPRTGAENMAVDQLLMERVGESPLLRIYHWSEPTVSFGYFQSLEEAEKAFPDPGVTYVRRWTGGGVVDHRIDVTYTLIVPRLNPVATMRGAHSYREIHSALHEALVRMGEEVFLTSCDLGEGDAACFANPVAFDITDKAGNKVAGAGQRRNKHGLLHQGSVVTHADARDLFDQLIQSLAGEHADFAPKAGFCNHVEDLAAKRYGSAEWLRKR